MPTKFGFYAYYDTPDGQDAVKKTLYTTRTTTQIGAIGSIYYMAGISRPGTALEVVSTFVRVLPAAAAVGFAYGSVASLSYAVTEKDSALNHLVAGVASGCVLGARVGTIKAAVMASLVFGLTAATIKQLKLEGVVFFPPLLRPDRGTLFNYKESWDPWFRK